MDSNFAGSGKRTMNPLQGNINKILFNTNIAKQDDKEDEDNLFDFMEGGKNFDDIECKFEEIRQSQL